MSAEDNRRMFDRIAGRYDRMNRILSLGLDRTWRRRAVELLAPRPGGRYLDVGTGTGDVAIEIARRCAAAEVVGIDPAEGALALARGKTAAAAAGRVTFRPQRATALEFPDASFDGAISAFCLRNVTDRLAALAEVRRVLAPTGRAVVLELTVPDGPLAGALHRLATARLVPLAGHLIARDADAYRYLVESVRAFPPRAAVLAMFDRAGFVRTRATPVHGGLVTIFTGEAPGDFL